MKNKIAQRTFGQSAALLLLHQIISTLGVTILSGVLVFAVAGIIHIITPSTFRASWLLTEVPGFPVQFLVAVGLGCLLGNPARSRTPLLVWIPPLGFLAFGASIVTHPRSSAFGYLIGNSCKPSQHCFDQLLFTLPFVAAFGYSIGAAVIGFKYVRWPSR
jgi:hypothetical protein